MRRRQKQINGEEASPRSPLKKKKKKDKKKKTGETGKDSILKKGRFSKERIAEAKKQQAVEKSKAEDGRREEDGSKHSQS